MFSWFWEFLYMISKTIFRLIDGLILCANKLCGIDPINFGGEDDDFLSYLLFSEEVGFAFRVSAILATVLLVIFTVFMIIRSIAKDKAEGTPAQIAVKAFKTLVMFFLVPLVMIAFMTVGNAFVKALYAATVQSAATPGAFLFGAFARDGGMSAENAQNFANGVLDYNNTGAVSNCMPLENFPFLFSWLAGGVVLFGIGSAMLVFVDRVLSIVILYIAAPISLSTSVLDDGARFKLWRDQFLSKFIMGYGMILAINIYAMVCGLVMKPGFDFFPDPDDSFLNLLMKLLIIGGGALTMQKAMALIGNLVSSGAGSNELRDNAFTAGRLARMAKGIAGAPFAPVRGIVGDAISMKSRDWGSQLLDKFGLGLSGNTSDKDGVKDPKKDEDSGSKNNDKAKYGSNPNAAKDSITKPGFKTSFGPQKDSGNQNSNSPKKKGGNALDQAINNGGKKESGEKKEDQQSNKNEGGNKK